MTPTSAGGAGVFFCHGRAVRDCRAMSPEPQTEILLLGQLKVPVAVAFLHAVTAYTASIARMLRFDGEEVSRLELAVEEAFTNSVKHFAAEPGQSENIHVDYQLIARSLVISLRERGAPFALDDVDQADNAGDLPDRPGMGLRLIRQCVDAVELRVDGHLGKVLRLTKHLPPQAEVPAALRVAGEIAGRRQRHTVTDENSVVRPPTEADLPALRRLAWRCYGYTYNTTFYDLERLTALFHNPCFKSLIAVENGTGHVFSHLALMLEEPDDLVPEQCMAFSDPGTHSPGVVARLAARMGEITEASGYKGLFANAVTSHVLSQRGMAMYCKTQPTALLMAYGVSDLNAVDLHTSGAPRTSVVVHFRAIDRQAACVYPPVRHRAFIAEVYGWLELPRTFGEPSATASLPEKSTLHASHFVENNTAKILVTEIGADCVDRVRSAMNDARKAGAEAIYLRLPLSSPAAPQVSDACEAFGLSFAGIIPLIAAGTDVLVMQWVGAPLDMGAIRIHGDQGRRVFDYVKGCLGY
jgi:anti-sigma regulatory factor (Ser/Thr protein kinase)